VSDLKSYSSYAWGESNVVKILVIVYRPVTAEFNSI